MSPERLALALQAMSAEREQLVAQRDGLIHQVNALTGERNHYVGQVNELTGARNELVGQVNALTGERNELVGQLTELMNRQAEFAGYRDYLRSGLAVRNLPATRADDAEERVRPLADSPLDVEDALQQAADLRLINRRLREKWYGSRLVVITCLEKSGSTSIEVCVREMLRTAKGIEHSIGIQKTPSSGPFTYIYHLYPEILLYVRDGGVLRSVLAPSPTNMQVLEVFRCKSVVLMRHPADRLVARYCQPPVVAFHGRWRRDPGQLVPNVFDKGLSLDEELAVMIREGYLHRTLCWMAEWLRMRHPRMSTVVRYEDVMVRREALFADLYRFLFRATAPDELQQRLSGFLSEYRTSHQPVAPDPRRYPRGYSGKVGVWRDYFSKENAAAYSEVVRGFLRWHPDADLLSHTYPDLVADPAEARE